MFIVCNDYNFVHDLQELLWKEKGKKDLWKKIGKSSDKKKKERKVVVVGETRMEMEKIYLKKW